MQATVIKLNGKKAVDYAEWTKKMYEFEKQMIKNSPFLYIKPLPTGR